MFDENQSEHFDLADWIGTKPRSDPKGVRRQVSEKADEEDTSFDLMTAIEPC